VKEPRSLLEELGSLLIVFCIVIMLVSSIFLGENLGYTNGYRQGQIDAIQGIIKYEATPDTLWEAKE